MFQGLLKPNFESPSAVASTQLRALTPEASPTKASGGTGEERSEKKKSSSASGGTSLLRSFKEKLSKGETGARCRSAGFSLSFLYVAFPSLSSWVACRSAGL